MNPWIFTRNIYLEQLTIVWNCKDVNKHLIRTGNRRTAGRWPPRCVRMTEPAKGWGSPPSGLMACFHVAMVVSPPDRTVWLCSLIPKLVAWRISNLFDEVVEKTKVMKKIHCSFCLEEASWTITTIPHTTTWWFIPLSKWVTTPVISGLTPLIPFITNVITHLRFVGSSPPSTVTVTIIVIIFCPVDIFSGDQTWTGKSSKPPLSSGVSKPWLPCLITRG